MAEGSNPSTHPNETNGLRRADDGRSISRMGAIVELHQRAG